MPKSKLTGSFIREFTGYVSVGLSNLDACKATGISESTLYKWLQEPRSDAEQELFESLEKARADRKAFHLRNIMKAAKDGAWQASAWYLERVYPEEFAKPDRYHDQGVDEAVKAVRELTETIRAQAERG